MIKSSHCRTVKKYGIFAILSITCLLRDLNHQCSISSLFVDNCMIQWDTLERLRKLVVRSVKHVKTCVESNNGKRSDPEK